MSVETTPFFVVSSGRSGTAMMERLFSCFPQAEMHHEYMVHHIQPLAVKYHMGLIGLGEVMHTLRATHAAAIYYSDAPLWGDASNKLSWLIPALDLMFPNARYIHLVRDGRKVASSYFHKLANECYDDHATAVLQRYYDARGELPAPPPEKKYWWPLPPRGHMQELEFLTYNQFQRIAFHWAEINRTIVHDLDPIPKERRHTVRLEDLVARADARQGLLNFLGLPWDDRVMGLLNRPHNVNRPEDYPLTREQTAQFNLIAGDVMQTFGYDRRPEYRVAY
ncbi:MAG: sulfotransferase [Alphaproteobacteria bacterium]|nr:sulfotransferase [Alphaproteobacteria bacterium]